MNIYKILCVIFIVIAIIEAFILFDKNIYNQASIGTKKEWANLQTSDIAKIKKEFSNNIKLSSFNGSDILIIEERCNILLNAQYPPYFKAMGNCKKIFLKKEVLDYLVKYTSITPTVYNVLKEWVR